jgi:hypothetical protein
MKIMGLDPENHIRLNKFQACSEGAKRLWGTRNMQLQPDQGTYPVPFQWSNTCTGRSGSGTFNYNWDNRVIGPVSMSCATLISLKGSGTGNITLRYYGL